MFDPTSRSESHKPQSQSYEVIVQAPIAWKQQIQDSLPDSVRQVVWKESTNEEILSHQHHLQAEDTLALGVRAAHEFQMIGFAIVVETNLSLMLAMHHDDLTELHVWTLNSDREACDLLRSLSSQINRQQISFNASFSHRVGRMDLFEESQTPCSAWKLDEAQRFLPLTPPSGGGLLSGSFNPLHPGHERMKAAAEEILEQQVDYEMTLRNADKPPLDFLSLAARSSQFTQGDLLLTAVPTFSEKAELFPKSTFVIGWDTAIRVLDRRFYPDGELESALKQFAERECRFLVAARRHRGDLQRLGNLVVPKKFRDLFIEIPPELFEEDISSTAIRNAWLRGDSELGPPLHRILNFTHND